MIPIVYALLIRYLFVSVGDCVEDQFQISGLDGLGSPVICGLNDGHHSTYKLHTHNQVKAVFTNYQPRG